MAGRRTSQLDRKRTRSRSRQKKEDMKRSRRRDRSSSSKDRNQRHRKRHSRRGHNTRRFSNESSSSSEYRHKKEHDTNRHERKKQEARAKAKAFAIELQQKMMENKVEEVRPSFSFIPNIKIEEDEVDDRPRQDPLHITGAGFTSISALPVGEMRVDLHQERYPTNSDEQRKPIYHRKTKYDFIYKEDEEVLKAANRASIEEETPEQQQQRLKEEAEVQEAKVLIQKRWGNRNRTVKEAPKPVEEKQVDEDLAPVFRFGADDSDDDNNMLQENAGSHNIEADEIDPLDAFMNDIEKDAVKQVSFGENLKQHLERQLPEEYKREKEAEEIKKLVITFDDLSKINELNPDTDPEVDEEDDEAFLNALKGDKHSKIREKEEKLYSELLKQSNLNTVNQEAVISEDSDDEMIEEKITSAPTPADFFLKMEKITKKRQLQPIDHSKVEYKPFRKSFYIESEEIKEMSEEDVELLKKSMGEIKIRGVDCPRPIMNWYQCGLSDKILNILVDKCSFESPFAIQCQAIPIIMSGRDCIGIAETGSGKTLAYVLPMLRHIMYQEPLQDGDGPIALIMVPTRELAQQVYNDSKILAKAHNFNVACVYGGAGIASQLSDLKKGAEIIVCTPGRMIDVLTKSNGKITNLRRVTYIVLDEADRMFDLGFEPQISRILSNVRPDRQTVLFSATFPRNVENLAKKILDQPIEIVVGNRGQVCKNVKQVIEIIDSAKKLSRLLAIIAEWFPKGQILIFVHKQNEADFLYTELTAYKYQPLVIHGGQDQEDRQMTISEFKRGAKTIMIATSLCARGLDIKNLVVVINYNCPSHKEDYIHRIGRTGRAGRKGTAITFITKEEERYSGDIIHAMQISNSEPPQELTKMFDMFMVKVRRGEVKNFTGLGSRAGTGYKFNSSEYLSNIERRSKGMSVKADEAPKETSGVQMTKIGGDRQSEVIMVKKASAKDGDKLLKSKKTQDILKKAASKAFIEALNNGASHEEAAFAAKKAVIAVADRIKGGEMPHADEKLADLYSARDQVLANESAATGSVVECFEINDYPESARKKVSDKEFLDMIKRLTGASCSVRGVLVEAGKVPILGQKKLHVHIEGDAEYDVWGAYQEVKKACEESAMGVFNSTVGLGAVPL